MVIEDLTGLSVRGLQEMLRSIAYYTGNIPIVIPDGIFSSGTKESVQAFQTSYGLPATGEVNAETWQKIREVYFLVINLYGEPESCMTFTKDIRINKGDENLELFVIQAMMYAISQVLENMPSPDITGIHDDKSVETVIYIQNASGLEPTGNIDSITYKHINCMYSSNVVKNIDFD